MKTFAFSILCVTTLLAFACKPLPKSDSTAQSLDNMVDQAGGGAGRDNECGVTFSKVADLPSAVRKLVNAHFVTGKKEFKQEAYGTLAAVPPALMVPFVMAGGRVQIEESTEAAAKICAAAPLTEEQKKGMGTNGPTVCWTSQPAVRIVLPPDTKLIRHGLLRALAYFYTENFIAHVASAGKPFDQPEWKRELDAFNDTRNKLKTAFLTDVESQGADALANIRKKFADDQLPNYVFAEALDSYFCSMSAEAGTSRAIFQSRFPATWKVFNDASDANAPIKLFPMGS